MNIIIAIAWLFVWFVASGSVIKYWDSEYFQSIISDIGNFIAFCIWGALLAVPFFYLITL